LLTWLKVRDIMYKKGGEDMGNIIGRSGQWLKKRLKIILLYALITSIIIVALTIANSQYGFGTFLVYLGIVIASIAAFANIHSNLMTRKALELTRITTRPFLSLEEADIATPEIIGRFTLKNTGNLPAENASFKVEIYSIPKPDRPEIIEEGEIPILFPNDGMTLFVPIDENKSINFPVPASDFVNLVNSGKEVHFSFKAKYMSFKEEYEFGKVLKLLPHTKGDKSLANLLTVEGSTYYK